MSSKIVNKPSFFVEFLSELKYILWDIIFAYKHFLHWTISRICISLWSIILWILIALPFFTLTCVLGWLDPVPWLSYFGSENIENQIFLDTLASNPYWLVAMMFLALTTALVFLLASSYSMVLFARLSLKYIERKKLEYSKNLYFSRKHITTLMAVISGNFLYLLAPVMIWCWVIFFIYLTYNAGTITFSLLSYLLLASTVILILALIYVIYRIMFGYIILAEEKDVKNIRKARKYLYQSIELTQGRNVWKFFFLLAIYSLFMAPFELSERYLQDSINSMKDALAFKSKLIENIDAKDMAYFEYITKQYESYENQELVEKIIFYSRLRILYFFFSYFAFGGLFILLISSFYVRVLKKD